MQTAEFLLIVLVAVAAIGALVVHMLKPNRDFVAAIPISAEPTPAFSQAQLDLLDRAASGEREVIHRGSSSIPDDSDYRFEVKFYARELDEGVEHAHYTKITGVKHANSDGSSRADAVARCKEFDFVLLHPEPENPFDPNAVALRLESGFQIGYLEKDQAYDISFDMRTTGAEWLGIFRKPTTHEGSVVGGIMLLCRLKPLK